MRSRKTNMLEAFRASAIPGSRRAERADGERADASSEPLAAAPRAPELDSERARDREPGNRSEHPVEYPVEHPVEHRDVAQGRAFEPTREPRAEGEHANDGGATGEGERASSEPSRRLRLLHARAKTSGDADPPAERSTNGWHVEVTRRTLTQIALFQLVLLSLSFFMGRSSVTPAEAAAADGSSLGARSAAPDARDNDADALARALGTPVSGELAHARAASAADPSGVQRGGEAFAPKTAADRAFWSVKNAYSVRAIQYPRTTHGEKMAWQTYDYLKAQGLPVVTPLAKGDAILICVGAKPAMADLDKTHERLRELPGPQPDIDKRPFRSAYLVNIEDVVGER